MGIEYDGCRTIRVLGFLSGLTNKGCKTTSNLNIIPLCPAGGGGGKESCKASDYILWNARTPYLHI